MQRLLGEPCVLCIMSFDCFDWLLQTGWIAEDACLPSDPPKSEYTIAGL